jgi:hypothetical protein
MQMAITGLKIGEAAPEAALVKQDGKAYSFLKTKENLICYSSTLHGILISVKLQSLY